MGIYRGPHIVRDGLVMLLDAGSERSYSGSGIVWTDLSGYGNHGTINSGEFVNLTNDGYLRNSGNISNFFTTSIPHSTTLNNTFTKITDGWSIEEVIWTNSTIYPEADAGSVISSSASSGVGFDWNHGVTITAQFRFTLRNGTNVDDVRITIPSEYMTLNKWRVRTMVWDRTNDKVLLYLNGNFIGEQNIINTSGLSLYDGGGIVFGSLYGWKHYGRRSNIKVYDKVLSADEVLQNFNAQKNRFNL